MKKAMVVYADLNGEVDTDLICELLGRDVGVCYGSNERGFVETNVYPIHLDEAKKLIDWGMENRIEVGIGRFDEADEEEAEEMIADAPRRSA